MEDKVKAKKIISINLVDSHPVEARIGEYLRYRRDSVGEEIKDLVLVAVGSFYDPLAIASNPSSSAQEIETALIDAVLALTHQRNRLIAQCQSKYGVNLSADCKLLLGLNAIHLPQIEPEQPIRTASVKTPAVINRSNNRASLAEDEDEDNREIKKTRRQITKFDNN